MATEEETMEQVMKPELWPLMSQGHRLLAMKRLHEDESTPDFGMMMDVEGDMLLRVYTSLREFAGLDLDSLDNNEQEAFGTPKELVEAGWRVD